VTVARLVELVAALEAQDTDELTPLHCAFSTGHTEAVAQLGEFGAALETQRKTLKQS
jgi:ankyrin repeat protein